MLELVRPVADELVVAVDADAPVANSPKLGALADRLVRVPLEPPLERYLPWLHNVCGGDWILRLEEDERPSSELLESLPSLIQAILIAQKEPKRLPKVAVRWLQRYLEEQEARLDDVALVVAALSALTGKQRAEAVRLRALAGSF